MGLGLASIQNTLELYSLGYLKNCKNILELGAQELHVKNADLKELYENAGLKSDVVDTYPNNSWPERPRVSAKFFYESLGIKDYTSFDINGAYGSIVHDLNKPYEDKSNFNKFDIVTDRCCSAHVFNNAECFKTMHNLTKPGGYIIVDQQLINRGNHAYFFLTETVLEGIAAANGYKVIYNSYNLSVGKTTRNGSDLQFLIPRHRALFNALDFTKIDALNNYGVLQKIKDEEFKIPYEKNLMKEMYNIPGGFNRLYSKEPISHMFVPSSTLTIEEARFKYLIKALIVKIKRIFRLKMSKKKLNLFD
tara:strand:+ start:633 stop:1550 length:918 start_codon:yes stop_codon:yes gene_type:complete